MNIDNFNPNPKINLNHKLEGFKLISLEVINHPVLGTNIFNFIDENDTSVSIYSTVIIGVNGTGKSYLFRFILELLRCLYFLAKGEDKYITDNRFELVYSKDKDLFVFTNKNSGKILTKKVKRKSFLWKNGDRVSFNTESPDTGLPSTIVANSITAISVKPTTFSNEKTTTEVEIAIVQKQNNTKLDQLNEDLLKETINTKDDLSSKEDVILLSDLN